MSKRSKKPAVESAGKKEKFNIKPWLIVIGVILLILASVLVVDFFDNFHYVRKLKLDEENDELIDKKHDITYVAAPECYEGVRLSKKPYARAGEKEFYQLGYLDPDGNEQLVPVKKMLATSRADGAVIYYNPDEISMPSMEKFEADSILVCDYYNTLDELTESETRIFLQGYKEGHEVSLGSATEVFTLRFRSTKYPWISYRTELFWENGLFYVKNADDNTVIQLPANTQNLFDKERLSLIASGGKS